jgi:uncharacterized repeat protein (TIGR03837 family)
MAAMQLHWDIFCRVVDNFGDIGVCWRLARQLHREHGREVRLWVDDLASLQMLCPATDVHAKTQRIDGITIRRRDENPAVDRVGDVIIEAFACELPPAYLAAMARQPQPPVWVNLEYLSAESWVEGCHGLASPHPSLPLTKRFFFPGFTPATGGLLREADAVPAGQSSANPEWTASLFCYESAPVAALLDTLAAGTRPVRLLVPPGQPLAAVRAHVGNGDVWERGALRAEAIPFLRQDNYDALLRRCDFNFVRGEDSFVRAQWAGRPFLWQIYRQAEDAHLDKLSAFLDLFLTGQSTARAEAWRALFLAWNGIGDFGAAWHACAEWQPDYAAHLQSWQKSLLKQDDLAQKLIDFCGRQV